MGQYHGDEPEIESEIQENKEAFEELNTDNWKYSEERLNVRF